MTGQTRVGVADDDYVVRLMIVSLVERDGRFVVVGEAADGREAVDLCARERPDVMLLDLDMPVMDGLTALPEIHRVAPECKIVMLSGMAKLTYGERARDLGASAFVEKTSALANLTDTIAAVAANRATDGAAEAPLPADEAERLAELEEYAILDDPGVGEMLDPILRLASRVIGGSSVAVNVIAEDRQWTAAALGMEAADAPRKDSICAHVVAARATLYVPDARGDARFANNPFVTGLRGRFRFYVGAPLTSSEGQPLGTLCVLDEEPRDLEPWQLQALEDLAWQVMLVFELRATAARLRDAEEEIQRLRSELARAGA